MHKRKGKKLRYSEWRPSELVAEAQRLRGLGYSVKVQDNWDTYGFRDEGDGCLWPIDQVTVANWQPIGPIGRRQKALFETFEGRQFLFEQWEGPAIDPEPGTVGWDDDPFDMGRCHVGVVR